MVLEIELFPAVEQYYQREGYNVEREVPMRSRVIDIICRNCEEIIAIEIKVRNWKKALRQAIIYQLCANKTYVALCHKYLGGVESDFFLKYGVGLIEVNGSISINIESKRNVAVNPFYKDAIIQCLERRRLVNENML